MIVWMVAGSLAWPACALATGDASAASAGTKPLAAASAATAAPASPAPATQATTQAATELMQLQEETLLLKAQLKKLDAQAQVAEREEALRRMGGPVAYGELALTATQSLGKVTSATLSSSDGAEFSVRAGEVLPNGMRVVSIRPGAVVLAGRSGHRETLAVVPPQQSLRDASVTGPANGAGLSPLPPLPTSLR
ncbi:type IV pilus biogenesis protein PilP [Trinickia dinghuensis]|uniref:Type IV pilus biogenesis protein PilP n=2 Tax=Trinickia dinghuensis TaxID=2291023 RepID=A0A3D8JVK9_9BURK|nr:type IV pilus biogenesis protein PilP [Trinickia dinghuensis]